MDEQQLATLIDRQRTILSGELWRAVESQQQIATSNLVDSLEEQELLEQLLETSKPPVPDGCAAIHYLLSTPFRYPPLPWGSRFGRNFERGIFYASRDPETALCEIAYYRLLFCQGYDRRERAPLNSQHLVFSARYHTDMGVNLHDDGFNDFHRQLTDPRLYSFCQALGSAMRGTNIQAFEFPSSRAQQLKDNAQLNSAELKTLIKRGLNVGLFEPLALTSKTPRQRRRLLVQTQSDQVQMRLEKSDGQFQLFQYQAQWFYDQGELPQPA